MMETEKIPDEKKYEGVFSAYEIALKSYDWSISRVDAADGAIDRLLVWISSINMGTLALSIPRLEPESFKSCFFLLSVLMFLACIVVGIFSKAEGSLWLPTPRNLYNQMLHLSEWEFKKNMIHLSAEDFQKHCALANRKGYYGRIIMWIFLGNLVTLVIWLISRLWT